MGLFGRNPNESAYTGGKKHFADVIKNSGPGDLLIWRQPEEDFNTNSTLLVMPGEKAIFVNCGNIEQVFDSGTYKLSTGNYPFISRLRNAVTGGISAFNCVVYFVRTAHSQEIFWGTATPIQARDKVWGVRTDIRARGSYKLHVDNPAMFLQKLLGNNINFETQDGINAYFVNEFQSKIKSVISGKINEMETELIGLDARMDEFSQVLEPVLDEILSQYGLKCDNFNVSALDVDNSKYENIDKAQLEATRKSILARGDAAAINTLGENWEKLQTYNIMTNLSNNPNVASVATMGAGLGMGMTVGSMLGNMTGQMAQAVNQPANQLVQESPKAQEDVMETLSKLKKMLDAGLIEQSEYDEKKKEILSRL